MHNLAAPPVIRPLRRRFRWLRSLALGAAVTVGSFILCVASFFWISGDLRALRNALAEAQPGKSKLRKQVELSLGRLPLLTLRGGVRCLPQIPPEAKLGLGALRGAEVGVYEWRGASPDQRGSAFIAAGEALGRRGWEPIVRVMNGEDCVAVFAPAAARPGDNLKLLVLVLSKQECVLASVTANPEALLALATQVMEREGRGRLLSALTPAKSPEATPKQRPARPAPATATGPAQLVSGEWLGFRRPVWGL